MQAETVSKTMTQSKGMTQSRGYAATSPKSALTPFEFQRRPVEDHDILINIKYCGVCHSDIHQARNEWKASKYPMVPGHEIVGEVAKVGRSVTKFKVGDRAGVGCFVDSCRKCDACLEGDEQFCANAIDTYNSPEGHMGGLTYGGYSNNIVVDENYALKVSPKANLASTAPLDQAHLSALLRLCEMVQPAVVSEHLCWNSASGRVINDLLPFPYTHEALLHVARRVEQVQEKLGRQLLLENLSSYLSFSQSEMTEGEFLGELTRRTGCGILFDVENLYVNVRNLGVNARDFISAIPAESVKEYHLAGYSIIDGCLVDTHNHPVYQEVWELYEYALQQIGPRPTLIEWESDIPGLAILMAEAAKAQQRLDHVRS